MKAPKLILIPGGWPGRKSSILGSKRSLLPQKETTGKGGWAKPLTFSSRFCGRRGRLDPKNRRFPARPAPGDKDKVWTSHTYPPPKADISVPELPWAPGGGHIRQSRASGESSRTRPLATNKNIFCVSLPGELPPPQTPPGWGAAPPNASRGGWGAATPQPGGSGGREPPSERKKAIQIPAKGELCSSKE